jgi:pyruvate dehydrogenase E1 component alpha subunit
MMAEMLGRATGYCRGRGGTMHIAHMDLGIMGANGIVGGGLAMAVGAALACQMRRTERVVLCFFGDGANNQGVFHEALNLASLWKLPVVFLCENNLYGYTVAQSRAQAVKDISIRATAYAMPGLTLDGMDVEAVYEGVKPAVDRARAGEGPSLIEAKTYRFMGHTVGEPGTSYRTQEEVESWRARDPISRLGRRLLEGEIATSDGLELIDEQVQRTLEEAVEFARQSPFPELGELERYVCYEEGLG